MIAGVCGGIADYFNMDPTIIRLILVALCFAGFSGLIVYIVAAIVIPEEPLDYTPPSKNDEEKDGGFEADENNGGWR